MKRHDKRDDAGRYRECSLQERSADYRSYQRKTGEPPRREAFNVTCFDAPYFKDGHTNRDGYDPFGKDEY